MGKTKTQTAPTDDGRSTIDHLADRAPARLQPKTQALALAMDKAATAARRPGRRPELLITFLAAVGLIGLFLRPRPAR